MRHFNTKELCLRPHSKDTEASRELLLLFQTSLCHSLYSCVPYINICSCFILTYFIVDQPVQQTYVYYRHSEEPVVQCKGYHNIPSFFLKYCGFTTMSRHARKPTLFSNQTYLENRYLSMRQPSQQWIPSNTRMNLHSTKQTQYDRIVIPGRPFVCHIAYILMASNCSHLLSPKKRIC